MKNLIFIGLTLAFFSSCKVKSEALSLQNSKWILTEMVGKTLPASTKATFNINNDLTFSGKSFCNNYGGKIEMMDNKIAMKNVFGTKMFCQESATAETAYLNALNQTNQAKMVDGKLQLLKNQTLLLVFSKSE